MFQDPLSGQLVNGVNKVRYTHDAVIDEILMNPSVSQNDLAKMFGYSVTWMSICINSDAFQERLAERKALLTDPHIIATINQRLDAIAKSAMDKIMERLDSPASGSIKMVDLVQIAKLGVGDKNTRASGPQTQNNLYVVTLPAPAQNAEDWLNKRSNPNPRAIMPFIENEAGVNRE